MFPPIHPSSLIPFPSPRSRAATAPLPFNVRALTLTSNLTLTAAPGTKPIDARVTLTARVSDLGLDPATAQYVRAIAGPRFAPGKDTLRMSADTHPDSASNKRLVIERLAALVVAAKELAAKYGELKPAPRKPAYSHTL